MGLTPSFRVKGVFLLPLEIDDYLLPLRIECLQIFSHFV